MTGGAERETRTPEWLQVEISCRWCGLAHVGEAASAAAPSTGRGKLAVWASSRDPASSCRRGDPHGPETHRVVRVAASLDVNTLGKGVPLSRMLARLCRTRV